jgi:hypothetical protein
MATWDYDQVKKWIDHLRFPEQFVNQVVGLELEDLQGLTHEALVNAGLSSAQADSFVRRLRRDIRDSVSSPPPDPSPSAVGLSLNNVGDVVMQGVVVSTSVSSSHAHTGRGPTGATPVVPDNNDNLTARLEDVKRVFEENQRAFNYIHGSQENNTVVIRNNEVVIQCMVGCGYAKVVNAAKKQKLGGKTFNQNDISCFWKDHGFAKCHQRNTVNSGRPGYKKYAQMTADERAKAVSRGIGYRCKHLLDRVDLLVKTSDRGDEFIVQCKQRDCSTKINTDLDTKDGTRACVLAFSFISPLACTHARTHACTHARTHARTHIHIQESHALGRQRD